jgi:predicted nucleotidyltransferase
VPPAKHPVDFEAALRLLNEHRVEYVVVGGLAAAAHGSTRVTWDVDVVYSRRAENVERLATALAGVEPYLRGAPAGLPFRWDAETIRRGLNFTLTTRVGDLDLLGEITGGGGYDDLLPQSIRVQAFGIECWCLGLEKLIEVKRAAGRPKDLEAIAELEALKEERDRRRI